MTYGSGRLLYGLTAVSTAPVVSMADQKVEVFMESMPAARAEEYFWIFCSVVSGSGSGSGSGSAPSSSSATRCAKSTSAVDQMAECG